MLEGNGIVRAGCGKPARPVRRGRTDRAIGPVSSLLYCSSVAISFSRELTSPPPRMPLAVRCSSIPTRTKSPTVYGPILTLPGPGLGANPGSFFPKR